MFFLVNRTLAVGCYGFYFIKTLITVDDSNMDVASEIVAFKAKYGYRLGLVIESELPTLR